MKLFTFNFPVLARLVATFLFLHSTRYYYNSILLQLDTITTRYYQNFNSVLAVVQTPLNKVHVICKIKSTPKYNDYTAGATHFELAKKREHVSISRKLLIQWTAYHIALIKVRLSYISVDVKQFNYKEGLTNRSSHPEVFL